MFKFLEFTFMMLDMVNLYCFCSGIKYFNLSPPTPNLKNTRSMRNVQIGFFL